MTDNMKKLLDKVSLDEKLTEKMKALDLPEKLIAFARELGVDLTEADLKDDEAKSGEIDDDELEAVAGGASCKCIGKGSGATSDADLQCGCPGIGYGYDKYERVRCICVAGGHGNNHKIDPSKENN